MSPEKLEQRVNRMPDRQESTAEQTNSGNGYQSGSEQGTLNIPTTGQTMASDKQAYKVLQTLARGSEDGLGVTYLVEDEAGAKMVAKLKIPGILPLASEADKAEQEIRNVVCSINRVNSLCELVAGYYDVFRYGPNTVAVREYIEGNNLEEEIRLRYFTEEEAFKLLSDLAEQESALHKEGIIHRDIKPRNVIKDKNGRHRIIDFSVAKKLGTDTTFSYAGTAGYKAREIWECKATPASDVFSTAMTAGKVLDGKEPETEGSDETRYKIFQRRVDLMPISNEFRHALKKAGNPNLNERYPTIDDFVRDARKGFVKDAIKGRVKVLNQQASEQEVRQGFIDRYFGLGDTLYRDEREAEESKVKGKSKENLTGQTREEGSIGILLKFSSAIVALPFIVVGTGIGMAYLVRDKVPESIIAQTPPAIVETVEAATPSDVQNDINAYVGGGETTRHYEPYDNQQFGSSRTRYLEGESIPEEALRLYAKREELPFNVPRPYIEGFSNMHNENVEKCKANYRKEIDGCLARFNYGEGVVCAQAHNDADYTRCRVKELDKKEACITSEVTQFERCAKANK